MKGRITDTGVRSRVDHVIYGKTFDAVASSTGADQQMLPTLAKPGLGQMQQVHHARNAQTIPGGLQARDMATAIRIAMIASGASARACQ